MVSAAIKAWQAQVNKDLGVGTVALGSELIIPGRFTSGSLALDVILGGENGQVGWPGNQWVEIYGPESSGKTATVLKTVAANQQLDPDFMTFWVAGETYDTQVALALGVDTERVVVAPSQDLEMSLELMLQAAGSKEFGITVLDSYPSQIPAEEDDKTMLEYSMASAARKFNQFWRKAGKASARALDGSDPMHLGIIVNQPRDKLGAFQAHGGTPQTTPGGHGKDFAYYTRVKVHREKWIWESRIDQDNEAAQFKVGQTIVWTTMKNKSASPQQVAKTDYYFTDPMSLPFRRGDYDMGKECVGVGILLGVIERSGTWLKYRDVQVQGKDAMQQTIMSEPELVAVLREDVGRAVSDPSLYTPPVVTTKSRKKKS